MGQADAILTSPPYAEGCAQTGGADLHPERFHGGNHGPVLRDYGSSEGQVGALRAGPCPGGEADVGDVETLTWGGCYSQGWGRTLLSPGAFAHPAKFAYGLLTRLYDHGFARGWWHKHSLVCDPFGGVGCGGVVAAYRGLRWVGCELEPRFVALAEETFALHRGKWAAAGDTPPLILQGDSRNFAAVVACVTSPTWVDPRGCPPQDAQGDSRRFAALVKGAVGVITSPPWVDPRALSPRDNAAWVASGRLPAEGSGPGTDLNAYGDTPGNVGGLPAGDAGAVVTSPPYEATLSASGGRQRAQAGVGNATAGKDDEHREAGAYGTAPGQVGALRQETYWDAVRAIYQQCFYALKSGGQPVLEDIAGVEYCECDKR